MGVLEGDVGLASQTEVGAVLDEMGSNGGLDDLRKHRREAGKGGLRASTSPPRINLDLPMPVLTTEQYWALLLTTRFSRPSM